MKLQTSIRPRVDGTVIHEAGEKTYVFVADENGDLSCDVDDEVELARLLATDAFWPADPADADAAMRLAAGDDDEDEDDENPDAQAIEANTPPSPARARGGRRKAA